MTVSYFAQEKLLPVVLTILAVSLICRLVFFAFFQLKNSREGLLPAKKIILNLLLRIVPYHVSIKKRPFYTAVRYIFHISLITVPIWFSGHILLWEESRLAWTWSAIPDVWADWMTILIIFFSACFLIKKIIMYFSGTPVRPSEWIILIITVLPFLSGYLYAYRHSYFAESGFLMEQIELIHVLSGETFMLMIALLSLTIVINPKKCTGCAACEINCPSKAITYREDTLMRTFSYQARDCINCAACVRTCPEDAVELKHRLAFTELFRIGIKAPIREVEIKKCDMCGAAFTTFPLVKNTAALIDNDQVVFCNDCKQIAALCMLNR